VVTSGASISTARFEERDGGVYVELEAIALSRDVPVRWIVNPIVRRVSRNSMLLSLQQTLFVRQQLRTGRPNHPPLPVKVLAVRSLRS